LTGTQNFGACGPLYLEVQFTEIPSEIFILYCGIISSVLYSKYAMDS
jgi:hypothetical protein